MLDDTTFRIVIIFFSLVCLAASADRIARYANINDMLRRRCALVTADLPAILEPNDLACYVIAVEDG